MNGRGSFSDEGRNLTVHNHKQKGYRAHTVQMYAQATLKFIFTFTF